jgi:hypothetical protein
MKHVNNKNPVKRQVPNRGTLAIAVLLVFRRGGLVVLQAERLSKTESPRSTMGGRQR